MYEHPLLSLTTIQGVHPHFGQKSIRVCLLGTSKLNVKLVGLFRTIKTACLPTRDRGFDRMIH